MCGFAWHVVEPAEVGGRVENAVDAIARALIETGERAGTRPDVGRWSVLEYAAHVRDVLLALRERTILACVQDHPSGTPIYRDERVDLGFYRGDTPDAVVADLVVAVSLFQRTFAQVEPAWMLRPITYSPAMNLEVDVRWMGAQAVHESEHHLSDVLENLVLLAAS